MTRLILAFSASESPDPVDSLERPRGFYEYLDDKDDFIVIWRRYGDEITQNHVVGSGIWENVTVEQIRDAIEGLATLPE